MKNGIPTLGIVAALLAIAGAGRPARAQEVTPTTADYSGFTVTVTADGFDLPERMSGGRGRFARDRVRR